MSSTSDKTVGRLTVHTNMQTPSSGYRKAADRQMELVLRGDGLAATGNTRPVIATFIGAIVCLLLAFGLYANSAPAIGSVGATLVGLALMIVFSIRRFGAPANERVRVTSDWLRIGELEARPLGSLDQVGIGEDGSLHTVWVRDRHSGRVLVFEGMTRAESDAARDALQGVIDSFRQASRVS